MKLKAQVVPFSSVVGTGVMLADETGAVTAQLSLFNGSAGRTPEEMVALCERIAAAINAGQAEGQVRHPGRGATYDVVATEALFQVSTPDEIFGGVLCRPIADGQPVTVYRNPDGKHFVRFPDEMVEPRFVNCTKRTQ